jgi:hypothetical protein
LLDREVAMPLLTFACPKCHKVLKSVATIHTGKRARCPTCGGSFIMPGSEANLGGAVGTQPPPPTDEGRRPWRPRRVVIAVAALLLLGSLAAGTYWLWSRGKAARDQEELLAYVPPGAEFVAGADLSALLGDPLLGPPLDRAIREQLQAGDFLDRCRKETGLDSRELLGHAILAGKLDALDDVTPLVADRDGPPSLTLVLKTTRAFDPRKVARAAGDAVARTAHGKTYYEVSEGAVRTLYMPSDRIIVLSVLPANELDALFTSDGTTPALSADTLALVREAGQSTVWMVVPFEGKTRVQLAFLHDNPPPPELRSLREPLKRAKGVAVWGRLDGDQVKLGINLACGDAADAAQAAKAIEALWKKQQAQLAFVELGLALRPRTARAYGEIKNSLKFTAHGATAEVTAELGRKTLAAGAEEWQNRPPNGGFGGVLPFRD